MNRTHRSHRSIGGFRLQAAALGALGALALLGGGSAQAQWGTQQQPQNARLVFEWQGEVDRETRISVGQRNVSVRGVYGQESNGRFVTRGSLPSGNGTLYIQRVTGRGQVDVIQQPGTSSGDGIVRIADTQGGAGYYDIRVYWQSSGDVYGSYPNGGGYPNNGSGYPNDGRDGTYERNGEIARGRGNVAVDRNGNVVYDRRGKVVHERKGNQIVVRDRNGNVVFDRNGKAVYQDVRDRRDRR